MTTKQTIKTSRTAGQLEKMFRVLNDHFFEGELPEVIISLKKTVGAYGHFTCGKVWQAGNEHRYEINISTATLDRELPLVCSTLLHEMCHEFAAVNSIKDTSGSGNSYHNKEFKKIAETHGLNVEQHPKYGWAITTPSLELLDFIEAQGWQDIQMVESVSPFGFVATGVPSKGIAKTGKAGRTGSTRKYICPKCKNSVRATKNVNIICGDCNKKMILIE